MANRSVKACAICVDAISAFSVANICAGHDALIFEADGGGGRLERLVAMPTTVATIDNNTNVMLSRIINEEFQ
jgi:uncharacterized protein (UPF0261 family)